MTTDYRHLLLDMFQAAAPALCVPAHLPSRPRGRTIVVGVGKAAASMAGAVEAHWNGPIEGLVVTRYGHGVACRHIEVVEASHPVPDDGGSKAARRILDKVSGLTADDLVLVLISGGGSALLALPADPITLADKQAINRALLKSGAPIAEMNTVRKHLSAIKGERLAVATAPARVVTLAISDVPGDDLSIIAPGPTAPDSSTRVGAILTPDTLRRARASGISAKARLADNNAYSVFAALDDLVVTGPTLTNVNDFRAIAVTKRN